jgi:hypothetical protein
MRHMRDRAIGVAHDLARSRVPLGPTRERVTIDDRYRHRSASARLTSQQARLPMDRRAMDLDSLPGVMCAGIVSAVCGQLDDCVLNQFVQPERGGCNVCSALGRSLCAVRGLHDE